jgi:hypothetical protein
LILRLGLASALVHGEVRVPRLRDREASSDLYWVLKRWSEVLKECPLVLLARDLSQEWRWLQLWCCEEEMERPEILVCGTEMCAES